MRSISIAGACVLFLLCGCVVWQTNTLKSDGTTETLVMAASGAGLLPGPCNFNWGERTDIYAVIVFHGERDIYHEGEFDILNAAGTRWDGYHDGDVGGTVAVDRKTRKVLINVRIKGKPFERNGTHSYKNERT